MGKRGNIFCILFLISLVTQRAKATMNPALVQGQHALVYNPMLPPGWIEHRTPTGQPYWYNTITRQTSWLFPSPLPPLAPQEAQPRKKKKQTK